MDSPYSTKYIYLYMAMHILDLVSNSGCALIYGYNQF